MNNFKKWLFVLFAVLLASVNVYADSAKQVDFLLSGYDDPTSHRPLSGGKVWTFLDGTSTLAPVWTDKDKGGVATNPVILDSAGKAEIYGDNIYKFVIYDDEDVLIQDIPGLEYQPVLVQPFNVDTIAALRLLPGEFENQSVQVLGYYAPGDGDGGPLRIWKEGASTGTYVDNGGSIIVPTGGDGSAAWIWGEITETSLGDWGGVADGSNANVLTDTSAVTNAFAYCDATLTSLSIPNKHWVLNAAVTVENAFDIRCDNQAKFRWIDETAGKSGFTFEFLSAANNLHTINLPGLYSPVHKDGIGIPGYSAGEGWNYNLNSRIESGVKIRGGDRIDFNVHYVNGWESGVHLAPQSGRVLANINVDVNTIDFCVKGINADVSEVGNLGMTQVVTKANTVWSKYPLYFDTPIAFIQSSQFEITGGALVNENGGCVVYGEGTNLHASTVRVNWAHAGNRTDSVPATPVGLVCPFLGGDQASNGLTNDGMGVSSDIGYFGGNHCIIDVGAAFDFPAVETGAASPIPSAGDTIRIRDAGKGNITNVLYSNYDTGVIAIPVSTTIGEANYNGGVGGAQFAENVFCSITLTALAAGASQNAFIYHQKTSPALEKPFFTVNKNEQMLDNGIDILAFQDSAQNRLVRLRVKNNSAVPYTGTLFFWVTIN